MRLTDLSETTKLPSSTCPTCSTEMDAASGARGQVPDPGDITICAYCGEVLEFTDDYLLAICTDDSIRNDPEIVRVRHAVSHNATTIETEGANDGR